MSSLRPSIEKRIQDRLVARLRGNDDLSLPDGLDDFTLDKDREESIPAKKTARISLYWLDEPDPEPTGGPVRKPMLLTRMKKLQVRVLLQGDDDTLDAFKQWITQCLSSASPLVEDDWLRGLVLSIRRGESGTRLLPNSTGSVISHMTNWNVEFTTLPTDDSDTGREVPA